MESWSSVLSYSVFRNGEWQLGYMALLYTTICSSSLRQGGIGCHTGRDADHDASLPILVTILPLALQSVSMRQLHLNCTDAVLNRDLLVHDKYDSGPTVVPPVTHIEASIWLERPPPL